MPDNKIEKSKCLDRDYEICCDEDISMCLGRECFLISDNCNN